MNKIFSGLKSKKLWKDINNVNRSKKKDKKIAALAFTTWEALYHLGCKCQELESPVRQQAADIEQLKSTQVK
jgi:hypothetical protein